VYGTCTLVLAYYANELLSEGWSSGPVLDGLIGTGDPYGPESEISDTAGRAGTIRPHGSCLICVTHAYDTTYIAVDAIAAHSRGDQDRVIVKFDEDADGVWEEDSSEGTYTAFVSGGTDSMVYSWLPGQQCPGGRSASGTASGNLQFEIAIPIGTRRSDLNINSGGDMSGAAISYWRGDSCYGWWPQSLELAQWDDPRYFGPYYWCVNAVAEKRSAAEPQSAATIVRGVLHLGAGSRQYSAYMLDISGRNVMTLHAGANDVSRLSPGVYFVHSTIGTRRSTMTKVIITR